MHFMYMYCTYIIIGKLYYYYLDPSSVSVNIVTLSDQTVGQPLTLECRVSSEDEIPTRIDFTWSADGLVLKSVEGVTATDNFQIYTDTYSISQLSTEDNGRIITCEVVISSIPLVVVSNNITLDVVGKNYYELTVATYMLL